VQEAAEPERIVVTQMVERAVVINQPAKPNDAPAVEAAPEGDQVVAFRPQDNGTNGMRRGSWPERGTEAWSNRMVQIRADMSNRYAQFRADWTNRVASDRTNFIAKAKLDEKQAERFDVLMTAMNVRLGAILDPLVAEMQSGQFPHLSTEERARLAHDVSGALVTTYDEMNRSMPEGWGDMASSNHISPSHFVDPQYQVFTRAVTGGGRGGGGFGGPPGGGFGGDRGRGGPPGGGGTSSGGATTGGGAPTAAGR
jgi:hypothetical protein